MKICIVVSVLCFVVSSLAFGDEHDKGGAPVNPCTYEYGRFHMIGSMQKGGTLASSEGKPFPLLGVNTVVRVAKDADGVPRSIIVKSTRDYDNPGILPVTHMDQTNTRGGGEVTTHIGRDEKDQPITVELLNNLGGSVHETKKVDMTHAKYTMRWEHNPEPTGTPTNYFKSLTYRLKSSGKVFLFRYANNPGRKAIGNKYYDVSSEDVRQQFFFGEVRHPNNCSV